MNKLTVRPLMAPASLVLALFSAACTDVSPSASASQPVAVAAAPVAALTRAYSPASIVVTKGARCQLHAAGSRDADADLPVAVDYDGVARFQAVRATASDATQRLQLDCATPAGATTSYPVDLAADATFAARPLDFSQAPGLDRPALDREPLSYSQAELIQRGYGLRPDPASAPRAYARWLDAATRPARLLKIDRPPSAASAAVVARRAQVTPDATRVGTGPNWTGGVLLGAPTYTLAEAQFVVPTPIPGGSGTGTTHEAIWTGLGGYNAAGGLIQGGIQIATSASESSSFSFTEYCCGDSPKGQTYTQFNINPGDTIYVQEWYCDASGNVNANINNGGAYGCSHVVDVTSGAIVDCTSATSPTCSSVPPLYQSNWIVGNSADFVVELQAAAWPYFTGTLTMTGSATSSTGATEDIGSDPSTVLLQDFTASTNPDHIAVSFIAPAQAPYGGYAPNLPPSVNWNMSTAAAPALPKAPNCSYSGSGGTSYGVLNVNCAGGNPGDHISIFQQIGSAWQYFNQGQTAGNNVISVSNGTTYELLACSSNTAYGWYTNAQGGQTDAAPVGPGDVGCDPVAQSVQIPACVPISCSGLCGIVQNGCGGSINCGACVVNPGGGGGKCTGKCCNLRGKAQQACFCESGGGDWNGATCS